MKSIVSYPERGSGGKNTYRGNCSPLLIEDLIRQYNPDTIADYMVGSGTTGDVAKRMGIPSFCYDLNRGFDLLNNEIKERPDFAGSGAVCADQRNGRKPDRPAHRSSYAA